MYFGKNLIVLSVIAASLSMTVPVGAQTVSLSTDFGPAIEEADNHSANFRVAEAEAAFQRALAAEPNNPVAYIRYASFRRDMGEYSEAFRLLQRAEALIADGAEVDAGPFYLEQSLGITYYRSGMYFDEAAAIFRQRVGRSPNVPTQHAHLAYSELGAGNHQAALRHLQIAEQLYGDNLGSYRASGLIMSYGYLGRRDDVLRLYARMQSMNEVSQAAWAAAHIALGDYPEALRRLESAISNPESIPGANNVVHFIASNTFDDPVLRGSEFQALFARLRGKE